MPRTPAAPAIRFIAVVYSSARDIYGNCYYYVTLTSTKSGKTIMLHTDGPRNVHHYLDKLGLEWTHPSTYTVEVTGVPKREHFRRMKNLDHCDRDLTAEIIATLETPEVQG